MSKDRQIIIILAGAMAREGNGKWRTASYSDAGDKFGLDGHRLRVVAASCLFDKEPDSMIIAAGGKGQYEKTHGAPTLSSVIKSELIDLGIPEDKIVTEEKSNTTFSGLKELVLLISGKKIEKLKIISNGWHLPRIGAMIEYCTELIFLKNLLSAGHLELCDADEILLKNDPKNWKDMIEEVRRSSAYEARLQTEQRGVEQIKKGEYKFR